MTVNVNGPAFMHIAKLKVPIGADMNELDFFLLFFPRDVLLETIDATNAQPEMHFSPLTLDTLLHFLGCLFAQTLSASYGGARSDWEPPSTECLVPSMNLGRFLSRNEFDRIKRNLRLSAFTDESLREDPWLPVRSLFDHFNECRRALVEPSSHLTVDESMSSWRGLSIKLADDEGEPGYWTASRD